MSFLKRLVVSQGEARLYELAKSTFGSSARERVFLKVRLADVIDLGAKIWTADEITFSLTSHFDLIVYDDDLNPTIAVEFDGRQHLLDVQARRDLLKDEICLKADLPLMRIDWDDLRNPTELVRKLREPVLGSPLERILCLDIATKLGVCPSNAYVEIK